MFIKHMLDYKTNLYDELSKTTEFEDICKGRVGAVLVGPVDGLIPIVRTTTLYKKPAQQFLPIHYDIIQKIKSTLDYPVEFNNALIEFFISVS